MEGDWRRSFVKVHGESTAGWERGFFGGGKSKEWEKTRWLGVFKVKPRTWKVGVSSPRFLPETKKNILMIQTQPLKLRKWSTSNLQFLQPGISVSKSWIVVIWRESRLYQEWGQQIHVCRGQSVAHDTADAANFHNNCTQRGEWEGGRDPFKHIRAEDERVAIPLLKWLTWFSSRNGKNQLSGDAERHPMIGKREQYR